MDVHDFILHGGPKEFLFIPRTEDAKDWFSQHIEADPDSLSHGVIVLWNYLDGLLEDVDDDGLSVQVEATYQ